MGIISAVILLTMASSVFVISRGLETTVNSQIGVIANLAEEFVSTELENLGLKADDIVEHLESAPPAFWQVELESSLERYSFFLGLSVFGPKGQLEHYGVAVPPGSQAASECAERARGGKSTISTTEQNPSGMLVFYFCSPMKADKVLVAALPGLYFSQLLREYKIWHTGSVYILDRDGVFIAGENIRLVNNRFSAVADGGEDAKEYFREALANPGGEGSGRYFFDGKERLAAYRRINAEGAHWLLGVAAPLTESPGGQLYKGLIAMGFIFLGFGALSALILSGFISKQFRTINEQNRHLADLNQIAKDASETKTNFLANMSHEMRTPLNAIVGFSELMLNGIANPEDSEQNLCKIHTAGVTLLGIVNDILDISQIESGKFELVPVEYEVASLINDTATVNMVRIGEKKITFKLSIDPDIPYKLFGDELRIKQICNNFLSNAFKYTKEGEVELSVSSAVNGEDVWLMLSVRDSGIGIKKDDIVKLFSAYNQVDTKSNRLIEGTGLGLSIAKRMAQMMDGTIDVESDYGKGSTFTATVKQKFVTDRPIGEEIARQLENFQFSLNKSALHRKMAINKMPYARVLIVDDVQTNLDVARGMLKPYGMTIDCVTSGQQAVNLIREHKVNYDAVFMDHMMPEMDGIEAVSIIRNQIGTEYARNIPIIALTANAIIGNDKMFLANGFQAYLSKPMDMSKVDVVLNTYIRDKEKEKELRAAAPAEPYSPLPGVTVFTAPAGPPPPPPPPPPEPELGPEPLKIEGVDVEAGLARFGGDEEIFYGALKSYATNTKTLLESIRDPNEDDLKNYMITVHGIKSSSNGVSAAPVGKLFEKLEHAAKTPDFSFIKEHNGESIREAEKLISSIEAALSAEEEKIQSGKDVLEKPDQNLIQSLVKACDSYDMDGIDTIIAELDKHSYQSEPNLVQWLKERADTLEFDAISQKFSSG
jgi:signal transduction histidine kinase/CheY-like chemotaxis protein